MLKGGNVIGYVMVGTSNLEKAIKFYDEILKVLDLKRIDTDNFYLTDKAISISLSPPGTFSANALCEDFLAISY